MSSLAEIDKVFRGITPVSQADWEKVVGRSRPELESAKYHRLLEDSLRQVVGATKDYQQANIDYFLDVESSGIQKINGNVWRVYSLPGGYGDGPSSDTTPILGFQIEKKDTLYSVTTYGSTTLSEHYRKILETFKFTN